MKIATLIIFCLALSGRKSFSQSANDSCKVLLNTIDKSYKGDCKKGLANGQGEATGTHKYVGSFKNGLPNGNGIYFYSDSVYYNGSFQDGLKEGKGEMHDLHVGVKDSLVKGYWSGNEYRGKTYITYTTDANYKFERVDISPTKTSGDRITIEISTTSGVPNDQLLNRGFVLSLSELVSADNNSHVLFLSNFSSANKATWVFQVSNFPAKLRARLSDGQSFNLELYKAANWTIRLFENK